MRKSPNVWYVGDRCMARTSYFPRYGKAPATIVQVHPYIVVTFDQLSPWNKSHPVLIEDLDMVIG